MDDLGRGLRHAGLGRRTPEPAGMAGDGRPGVGCGFEANLVTGLVDLVSMTHEVCDEVRLEPTTGHTPGHVSIHIESEGQHALITGDCFHHPCQFEKIEWSSSADYNHQEVLETREQFVRTYGDQDVLIIGTHFATPTAGHVKALGENSYWLDVSTG